MQREICAGQGSVGSVIRNDRRVRAWHAEMRARLDLAHETEVPFALTHTIFSDDLATDGWAVAGG